MTRVTTHRPALISRRPLLALAGGLLAAPLLPAAPALAAGFGLTPSFGTNWRVHKTSTRASIRQLSDGNGILADSPAALADIDTGSLALWSRQRAVGSWTIAFGYQVVSRLSDPGGTFCCFYFNGVGEGSSRYPLNVADWRNIRPSDTVYFRHSRGLRFSFATFNPDPQPGFPTGQLRLRRYNRSNGPLVPPNSAEVFPFTTGVPYQVAVTRRGSTLTVAVTDRNTGARNSHTWTDARIAEWRDGHVGFRWRGQDARVTDLTYTQL